jgi:hypothetical protein
VQIIRRFAERFDQKTLMRFVDVGMRLDKIRVVWFVNFQWFSKHLSSCKVIYQNISSYTLHSSYMYLRHNYAPQEFTESPHNQPWIAANNLECESKFYWQLLTPSRKTPSLIWRSKLCHDTGLTNIQRDCSHADDICLSSLNI